MAFLISTMTAIIKDNILFFDKFIISYIKAELSYFYDVYFDFKLNIHTIGIGSEPRSTKFNDAIRYFPIPYLIMQRVFTKINLRKNDVFIDLGSGKGRVVLFASQENIKMVKGIEIQESLFIEALKNKESCRGKKAEIELIRGDVTNFSFSDETIIFIFHPFGSKTMELIMGKIESSLSKNPRKIKIITNIKEFPFYHYKWLKLKAAINNTPFYLWSN